MILLRQSYAIACLLTLNEIFILVILYSKLWKNIGALNDGIVHECLRAINITLTGFFIVCVYMLNGHKFEMHNLCTGIKGDHQAFTQVCRIFSHQCTALASILCL